MGDGRARAGSRRDEAPRPSACSWCCTALGLEPRQALHVAAPRQSIRTAKPRRTRAATASGPDRADTPVGRVTALRRSLIARSSPRDHAVPPRASFRVAWLASDTLWDVLPVAPVGAREDPLIPSDQLLFGHDSYVSLRS